MREVILDTETTGLEPDAGHRVVEIACLELINHVPTGRTFRRYVNPERDMPDDAFRVHGLSAEFLSAQPKFDSIAAEFLAFIGEDTLVIHNAEFDIRFLNAELARLGLGPLESGRVVCTLTIARERFPGAQASLDALCRRFEIDNSARALHGALLDCELLSEVYLELKGGRQPGLELEARRAGRALASVNRPVLPPRPHAPSAEEIAAHGALVARLADPVWSL